METLILTKDDIRKKLIRMAYEIAEQNADEKEIIIVGIKEGGYEIAKRLSEQLKNITSSKIILAEISLNKHNPAEADVKTNLTAAQIENNVLIFIDDVANSGKTLLYAMKPLMKHLPKKVSVAVLVDRKHKLFPVSADIVGLSLSTNMHEHISVLLGEKEGVYLS